MSDEKITIEDIPEAIAAPKKRFRFQMVWIIPIIAALIGGGLAIKTYMQKGPVITITFKTGEGLEAGKTKIKYKEVDVGIISKVTISNDLKSVIATADMIKGASSHLYEDTKFWVVRPRISGGTVSGLGTVLSGAFIAVDVGKSTVKSHKFIGLESAPPVTADVPGTSFALHGDDLSSLDIGSPVYYRRMQVGQVISYELDKSGKGVSFKVFINAPYDKQVKMSTRFWNASGVDLTLDASGMTLRTQSLVTMLSGGIAFQTFDNEAKSPPNDPNTVFTLFASHDEAIKNRENISQLFVMVFNESVRGLTVGAPVDFRGVIIGEVSSINIEAGGNSKELNMLIGVRFYPERLFAKMAESRKEGPFKKTILDNMVANGLRAQLKTGNLLTGQLYVAVDFFPTVAKNSIDWKTNPPHFPTTPASMTEMQATLTRIFEKFEKMPVEELAKELRSTLQTLDKTLQNTNQAAMRVDSETLPEIKNTLDAVNRTLGSARQTLSANAPLQQDLRETLRELNRAAQSMRTLTDYLERHPESLIRGKQEDKK